MVLKIASYFLMFLCFEEKVLSTINPFHHNQGDNPGLGLIIFLGATVISATAATDWFPSIGCSLRLKSLMG
jgi:hypothetical protein